MTTLHHVGLTVADLEASIEFYCTIIGCTIRERSESSGPEVETLTGVAAAHIVTADLELPNGAILELVQYLSPTSTSLIQLRHQPGHTHIGLLVEDVNAIYDRLRGSQALPPPTSPPVTIVEPGSAWDGLRAFYVCDPDGRTIEFLEMPVARR